MSKIIKLGMAFDEDSAPDFGSITMTKGGDYLLLADDISKLNSALIKTVCKPLLVGGSMFNVSPGAIAFVADWKTAGAAKAYIYECTSDTWYEFIEGEG